MPEQQLVHDLTNLQKSSKLPKVIFLYGLDNYDHIINSIISSLGINKIDVQSVDCENNKKSIGIDDVKAFRHQINSKAQGGYKLGIIYHADCLTIEASNSLLKIIEELPKTSFIILCAKKNFLSQTLYSRVVYHKQFKNLNLTIQFENIFLNRSNLTENLLWIDNNYNKINITEFLENCLYDPNNTLEAKALILSAIKYAKLNTNGKLILDNLALDIFNLE